jgi:uncharacterized membrane protein YcaP (DUF421 family)
VLNDLWQALDPILGLEAETLTAWQMGLRALVVYVLGLAIVRIGEKRFIGKFSAFDVILGFMLGSTLAGAISGSSPFSPSLFAAICLVGIHFVFARLSFRSDWFGTLVKGHSRVLVTDGEIDWDEMRKGNISEKDLLSALRENGHVGSPSDVKEARLERSGNISVISRDG